MRARPLPPPSWTREQLAADQAIAVGLFRQERLSEPTDIYHEFFEEVLGTFDTLLAMTVDLLEVDPVALDILSNKELRRGFRYLAGPPISDDDWQALADVESLARTRLAADPDGVQRLVETVFAGLDRGRFPWVTEGREPTEGERQAAVVASATMLAMRRAETARRTKGNREQEAEVRAALLAHGFTPIKIPKAEVKNLSQAPERGEFAGPVMFGPASADILVGLRDGRTLAIECKVSNSFLNSVKRLNRETASKAEVWRRDFGELQVVPAGVLSGLYRLHLLEDAQRRGLALFWSHRLDDLTSWIERAR